MLLFVEDRYLRDHEFILQSVGYLQRDPNFLMAQSQVPSPTFQVHSTPSLDFWSRCLADVNLTVIVFS